MIKVIAIVNNKIGVGGGFDQALNAVVQMQRLSQNGFKFEVFATHKSSIDLLNQLGVAATAIKISIFDKLIIKLRQAIFNQRLMVYLNLIGPLEKKLIKHKCDVVYFVTPSNLSASLQVLNYISTLWDLSHRENPEFPEVRNFGAFYVRERNYQHNIGPALLTLTDSQRLADMASKYYGIDRNRFLEMPFVPAPFLDERHSVNKELVRKKYHIDYEYFFYPAQFFAHKNHIRILQALLHLARTENWRPMVVFTGKDYGNLAYIQDFIRTYRLESQVKILGFVPSEDMRGLYENATAVVMPTYFGPTNMPPLEAWAHGKPLIYSAHLAEQARDAALLVDPDNEIELSAAMLSCTKPEVCKALVTAGTKRLADIVAQRDGAEAELCLLLEKFAARRLCWG